jgi:hypothetical protein
MTPASLVRSLAALPVVAAIALAPAPARASQVVEGVRFEGRVGEGERALELCSAGLLRWNWVLKVYVAALYRDDCSQPLPSLGASPKRLEISYLRGFSAEQFAKAANAILERTFSSEALAPLRERIERMNAAYRPVEEGDRYALTYRPGVGTELALNGEPLVTVEGAEFAAAYFAIWLGPDPADEGLKRELLETKSR